MDFSLLEKPLLHVFGHDVSFLGLIAFVIWFSVGIFVARALQSDAVRRVFSRFKIDINLIAILTTILRVAAVAFFTMNAVNAAGVPLSWNAPLPGVTLSLVQIFLLIALLVAVFPWRHSPIQFNPIWSGRLTPRSIGRLAGSACAPSARRWLALAVRRRKEWR